MLERGAVVAFLVTTSIGGYSATTAQAASGIVYYKAVIDGQTHPVIDPADFECRSFEIAGANYAVNDTNVSVRFYPDESCGSTTGTTTLEPNQATTFDPPTGSMMALGAR
ncbi:hypothetical protein [Nocardia acidivorans]|uniref:hypothetical protein n=1 Tax=Nocardia acidivorans TaxID=404580 RepID=UPI00082F3931|nr:hypothetical protein [Nocardia acidivorans]